MGSLTFLSMVSSNYSLKFVNYPFMVLAKSAKVLPVIMTGWIRGVYKFRFDQAAIALSITTGLVIFNSSKMKGLQNESVTGVSLVLLSLFFDGIQAS